MNTVVKFLFIVLAVWFRLIRYRDVIRSVKSFSSKLNRRSPKFVLRTTWYTYCFFSSLFFKQNIIVRRIHFFPLFFYHQTQILISTFRVRSSINMRVNIHSSSCSTEGCAVALDTTTKAGMENWNAKWRFLSLSSPLYFVHEKCNIRCIPEHTLIGTNTLVCWSRISRIVV